MNNAKKKTNVIVIAIIVSILIIIIAGAILYLVYKDFLPLNSSKTTVYETSPQQEEKFSTNIEFEYFDDANDYIEYIEGQTQYDFPDGYYTDHFLAANVDGYAVDRLDKHKLIAEYVCDVHLNNIDFDELDKFEKQLTEDERFVESLGDLKVLISSVGGDNIYEYKMVYNMDTKEYNTMPDKAGEYGLITVFYDSDNNYFVINRFNNKYWKLEK